MSHVRGITEGSDTRTEGWVAVMSTKNGGRAIPKSEDVQMQRGPRVAGSSEPRTWQPEGGAQKSWEWVAIGLQRWVSTTWSNSWPVSSRPLYVS